MGRGHRGLALQAAGGIWRRARHRPHHLRPQPAARRRNGAHEAPHPPPHHGRLCRSAGGQAARHRLHPPRRQQPGLRTAAYVGCVRCRRDRLGHPEGGQAGQLQRDPDAQKQPAGPAGGRRGDGRGRRGGVLRVRGLPEPDLRPLPGRGIPPAAAQRDHPAALAAAGQREGGRARPQRPVLGRRWGRAAAGEAARGCGGQAPSGVRRL